MKTTQKEGRKSTTRNIYPYKLRPVEIPDDATLKRLDKSDLLEFIRVEALLRSPKVHKLFEEFWEKHLEKYKSKKWASYYFLGDSLFLNYGVDGGWLVIGGSHHKLLSLKLTDDGKDAEYRGVLDISSLLNAPPPHIKSSRHDLEHWLLNRIKSQDERWLWLRIDTSYPPYAILKALEKELTQRHKKVGPKPQDRIVVIESDSAYSIVKPTYANPFRDFKTWINYFQCYDLRYCEGLTYGQIALKVFGRSDTRSYDLAKKACKRIKQVITAAEENNWPPFSTH